MEASLTVELSPLGVRCIRIAAFGVHQTGDQTLTDEIHDALGDTQVDAIEERADVDVDELVLGVVVAWQRGEVDLLFELLEAALGRHGVEVAYPSPTDSAEEEDDEDLDAVENAGEDTDDQER